MLNYSQEKGTGIRAFPFRKSTMGKRTYREPKIDKLGAGTSETIRPFDRPLTCLDEFVLEGGDPSAVSDLSHDTGEVP